MRFKIVLQELKSEYSQEITEQTFTITPACEAQLASIVEEAEEEFAALRIFVEGGGCNGLSYGMTYDDGRTEYDSVRQFEGFQLVVDAVALSGLGQVRAARVRSQGRSPAPKRFDVGF